VTSGSSGRLDPIGRAKASGRSVVVPEDGWMIHISSVEYDVQTGLELRVRLDQRKGVRTRSRMWLQVFIERVGWTRRLWKDCGNEKTIKNPQRDRWMDWRWMDEKKDQGNLDFR
jgi:hypothetical protein